MDLDLTVNYPLSDKYTFQTRLLRLNLDDEKAKDLLSGKGFIIDEPEDDKKAIDVGLKSDTSIFSPKFTRTLQDPNAFTDRYSCKCKHIQGKNYEGMLCPFCHTRVIYVGEDFEMTGWITLKEKYPIIHPNLYYVLESYIGKDQFASIIEPSIDLDENGKPVQKFSSKIVKSTAKRATRKTKLDEKYKGIGLIEFYQRFDEILEYFHKKKKLNKIDYYRDIVENRANIFIHSIPVYSTALRPFDRRDGRFTYEKTNGIYNMMAKLAAKINDDTLSIYRIPSHRNVLVWNLQQRYLELYNEVINICKDKNGIIKRLIGGRCGFTSRSIIVPDPKLRVDQVTLSYFTLLELLQQTVINILVKSYNVSYNDAYMRYKQGLLKEDPRIRDIIQNIIDTSGVNVLINRNPTINYGSILAVKCVAINDDYTMGMPLQILSTMAADFDGDCLNIIYVPNKKFWESAMEVFNPRNAMMISRNDGTFNNDMNIFKDMIINANGLINLGREYYTIQQKQRIQALKTKYGLD